MLHFLVFLFQIFTQFSHPLTVLSVSSTFRILFMLTLLKEEKVTGENRATVLYPMSSIFLAVFLIIRHIKTNFK